MDDAFYMSVLVSNIPLMRRKHILLVLSAYLMTGGYNVYQVDWTELCPIPCYPSSVYNVRGVARCVARLLSSMRAAGVPVETTTCVGHSLGAHVCGIASTFLDFIMHKIIGKMSSSSAIPTDRKRINHSVKFLMLTRYN